MRASLAVLVLALLGTSCRAPRPPIEYGGAVTHRNDQLFTSSLQAAFEHCSGNKGALALPAHEFVYAEKRWQPATLHPERCYFKAGGLLQAFAQAVRLTAPGAPSFDVPQDSEKLWGFTMGQDDKALNDASVALFGRGLVRGTEKTATGETVRLYDGPAMKAIFAKVYARPSEMRAGFVLQQVYDVLYKSSLETITDQLVLLEANPDLLQQALQEFEQQAPTKADFNFYDVADRLQKPLAEREPQKAPALYPSFVGTVVRRMHDGSLPVLKEMLRQVLQDYDPQYAATVAGRL